MKEFNAFNDLTFSILTGSQNFLIVNYLIHNKSFAKCRNHAMKKI